MITTQQAKRYVRGVLRRCSAHLPSRARDAIRRFRGGVRHLPPLQETSSPIVRPQVICDSAIVCPNEINSRHGTGVLLQYMFPQLDRMAVLESTRFYDRERAPTAVTWELPEGLSRADIYRCVLDWFCHAPPQRAYVVPYLSSDLLMGLALKDLFGTRLVLHVMDDNTLIGEGIPAELMEEAIVNCDVRFAISPEMRTVYEQRWGQKFYLLPPVVRHDLIDVPHAADESPCDRGAIIGNLWSAEWVDRLAVAVRESGLQLDWFCNNPKLPWVADNLQLLARSGINLRDPLWGDALVKELRRRPYLVLPTGDPADRSAQAIAKLSLPSRVIFHTATVRTPVIVMGSAETAVAKFVDRFQLGAVVPYKADSLREAAAQLNDVAVAERVRRRCGELSGCFSARDIETWIWQSMEAGRPPDDRFESLFDGSQNLADYVAPPPPRDLYWAQHAAWQMLTRYRRMGCPQTIIDVGSSTGHWSLMASRVFPQAHFVLCEPMFRRYPKCDRDYHLRRLPSYELVEMVITDHCGQASFMAAESLYGSSLISVEGIHGATSKVDIKCTTLDELDKQQHWQGPVLLKADVQLAEHLVIAGASQILRSKVDAVFLELSLARAAAQAKTYAEMVELMANLGFELFDEAEGWRDPKSGKLEQKDVLFVKRSTLEGGNNALR